MRQLRALGVVCLLVCSRPGAVAGPAAPEAQSPAWPAVTRTAKPWARWWWPGSAVDRAGLSAQLEKFAAASLGGVEITPIYGARGAESRYLDFLSARWVEMLEHAAREAARLDLGIDMATGTGWPFGGPAVSPADASSNLRLVGGRLAGVPTVMKVKRAAPGGEGLVLDPYSTAALGRYLEPFTRALSAVPRGLVRGQFHDSFEYYNAAWTAELGAAFEKLNGYDLQAHAAELMGEKPVDEDTLSRLKGDYRRTLAQLHLDYVRHWVEWSRAGGFLARNQAHGAPGNLLDLYAIADIPETESFGQTALDIAGMRPDAAGATTDPDPPLGLVGRFASSAAHVAGRPLASSETLTWLRENFREAPWQAKPQLDRLFVAGINHIFYHGMTYSPPDAPWPGWFFYAATQMGPNNPLWEDFAAMNGYVARVQSILQAGQPDNEVLLYWPFDELSDDAKGLMRQYGVHQNEWLAGSTVSRLALELIGAGYAFDLVSDAQLAALTVADGVAVAPGGRYRAVVVPRSWRMSPATLRTLRALLEAGVPVVFEALPQDVPGLGRLAARRAELQELVADARLRKAVSGDVPAALAKLDLAREAAVAAAGLGHIRRARPDGHDYFLVNFGAQPFDGWLQLGTPAEAALLLDPVSGRAGMAAVKRGAQRAARVHLQLASGESLLLRTQRTRAQQRGVPPWPYVTRAAGGSELRGPWHVEFLRGGPVLPAAGDLAAAGSWTQLPGEEVQRFAGTARYRIQFDTPGPADDWLLELGDVRESARVRLNGREIGTAWSLPFSVRLGADVRPRGNVLEIDVTSMPANRIRDLDRRKADWKIMRDINLASLRYRALDASEWEVAPAGLLGPVRLVPLAVRTPR
jgi:hypothetical protein